MNKLVNDYAH
jgi:hypothetical protein